MIPLSLCNANVRRRLRGDATASAIILAVVLAIGTASSVWASTYYVDNQHPNSSAAGPGTESTPYHTISSAVAARKGPGVTIVVKPGIYREQVVIPASGTPEAPYVIRAAGPGVVVDGADSYSSAGLWVESAAAVIEGPHGIQVLDHSWRASNVTWAAQQVIADGRRLTPSTVAPEKLPVNAFTWVQGQGLYVNLGGDNPGRHELLVGRRPTAFRIAGRSWVTIEGFDIKRVEDAGINVFFGSADLVLARNQVTLCKTYGIKVSGGARVVIEGNSVSESALHGIGLTNGTFDCTLRNNDSFRNAQAGARISKGIYLENAPNNVLVGNRTYDNQDSGVQLNPGSHSCLLSNNRSWNNGDHGFDHLDVSGTRHLHNVAYGNLMDGFSVEGDSPNTRIFNCISTENGLTTGHFNLWVNAASAVGFASGHNIIWNSTDQEPIKFMATQYSLLADFNAASGQDNNSLQENPMFAGATIGDFMPLPGSPAIDAGDSGVADWPAYDFAGNPRYDDPAVPNTGAGPVSFADIGAFELVPSPGDGAAELASPMPITGDRRARLHGDLAAASPGALALSAGFPNPSNGPVEFALDLPRDSQVEWAVYDLQGRTVWSQGRTLAAGRTQLRWDGIGSAGVPAATGIYHVRARVDGAQFTRRIIRF